MNNNYNFYYKLLLVSNLIINKNVNKLTKNNLLTLLSV